MNRRTGVVCLLAFAFIAAIPASAGDFKGFYIGANIGGSSGHSDASTSTIFSSTGYFATSSVPAIAAVGAQHPSPSGFTGGGQAGYNFQHKSFVIGVETDFGGLKLDDTTTGTATYPCCPTTGFTIQQKVNTDWLFTLRPRVGFTGGPLLVYGTGGLAVTNLNYSGLFTDTFATAHESATIGSTQMGWVAGGGVEFKQGKHWIWRGEYLYGDFGSVTQTSTNLTAFTPPIAFPSNVFTHTADLTAHIYRFGFNYQF